MTILLAALQTTAHEGSFHAPYVVGGGILVGLFGAMAALLSFGKGREHS
ncbi:MAG: hypothetical protein JWR52_266 [Marmoricola sp.]|nr:hypothetical protein [Marmoricola sp.]MCW2854651.1 hypothetical protein [Marmoricola sp.]